MPNILPPNEISDDAHPSRFGGSTPISAGLSLIEIGTRQSHRNLSVFPLLATSVRPVAYITLDEALDRRLAAVTEVSESGVGPELRFENMGDTPVLLVDGEELVGARQNRVLNLTILGSSRIQVGKLRG